VSFAAPCIAQGLRKVTLATTATPGLHRIGASQCFRFVEGARLRSGFLLVKCYGQVARMPPLLGERY
jgi:hypothetical protein